jgi:hypothetical protein
MHISAFSDEFIFMAIDRRVCNPASCLTKTEEGVLNAARSLLKWEEAIPSSR